MLRAEPLHGRPPKSICIPCPHSAILTVCGPLSSIPAAVECLCAAGVLELVNSRSPTAPAQTRHTPTQRVELFYSPLAEVPNTASLQPDAQIQTMKATLGRSQPAIALLHGATIGRGAVYGDD